MRLPTRLDRYPAKMVSRLADRLIEDYAGDAEHVLDPFCGSGAIIAAASKRGIRASGVDLNPVAQLHFHLKTSGFDCASALALTADWIGEARHRTTRNPIG